MSGIIGITMGDPCGVGPEISVRALVDMSAEDRAATRIYGNLPTLEAAREALGLDLDLAPHVVDIEVEGAPLPWGTLSPVITTRAISRSSSSPSTRRSTCP